MAPSKKQLTGQSVKQFLATRPMQDKQHVFAVGAFGVFVEPDVGAQLRAETADGLGTAIPFQIESDGAIAAEVKTLTIRRGDWSSMFLGPGAPAAAAALLTNPEQQPLVHLHPTGQGQIYEEPVGLQVVGEVPAVVAGIFRPADIGPRGMPAKLRQQPASAWCEQEHRWSAGEARRIDH